MENEQLIHDFLIKLFSQCEILRKGKGYIASTKNLKEAAEIIFNRCHPKPEYRYITHDVIIDVMLECGFTSRWENTKRYKVFNMSHQSYIEFLIDPITWYRVLIYNHDIKKVLCDQWHDKKSTAQRALVRWESLNLKRCEFSIQQKSFKYNDKVFDVTSLIKGLI